MTGVPIVLSLLCAYVTLSAVVHTGESTFTEEDLRDVQHPRFRRNPRLCGTVLLTALSSVCDSTGYNSPPNKRTGSFSLHQRHNSHNEVFDLGAPGQWSGEASDEYQLLPSEVDPVTDQHVKEPVDRVDTDPHSSYLPSSFSSLLRGRSKGLTGGTNSRSMLSSSSSSSSASHPHSTILYRSVRSLTDECCKSPCSMSQLKAYCGGEKKRSESDMSYAGSLLLPFMSGASASPGQFQEYAE